MKENFNKLYYEMLKNIDIDKPNLDEGMQTSPGFTLKLDERLNEIEREQVITSEIIADMLYNLQPKCITDVFFVGFFCGLKDGMDSMYDFTKHKTETKTKELVTEFVDSLDTKSDAELASMMIAAFKVSARMWIEAREQLSGEQRELQDNEFANFIKSSIL